MGPIDILLGVLFPIFVTVGSLAMGASTPIEFWAARLGFIFAAIDLGSLTVWWLYKHGHAPWQYVIGVGVFAFIVVALPSLFRWVDQKEVAATRIPKNTGTLFFAPSNATIVVPKIQFGTANVIYGTKELGNDSPVGTLLFPALTESQFKIELIDGKYKVSTQIRDQNSKLLVELVRNEWKVAPPPDTWDRNYSDDALEVKDPFGAVILQVRALPDRVQIQGMWWWNMGPPNGVVRFFIRGNPQIGGQINLVPLGNKDPLPVIDPMFVYPSDAHLGELRQ
jgi:hypothetical protein